MLHYCVTGRRITTNDIQFTEKASQTPSSSEINLIPEEHRGVWMAEQEFMNMLRDGNPNYLDALARSYSLSDGPRFDTGNSCAGQSQPPLSSLHSVQEQPSKVV